MMPKRWIAVGIVVALAGCSRNHPLGASPRTGMEGVMGGPSRPGAGTTSSGGGVATSRKRVTGKEEPGTLIASDRTQCIVTAGRFKETTIGENVWCDWQAR